MALTVKINGDSSSFENAVKKSKNELSGLADFAKSSGASFIGNFTANFASSILSSLQNIIGKGIDLGVNFIIDSSKAAADTEALTSQFETLLKSKSAATKRMEEIAEFAANTPFEIEELAKTSKLLQTLGGTLLATGNGLRMVGDAAAVAGEPIGEIGLHIGRLFGAITSGTSAGESVGRLQELGLISGDAKRKFEALAESQKKGETAAYSQADALKLLQETLKDTDGAMARLAATTQGKLSNLSDTVSQLKVAFGTGLNDGLREAIDKTIPMLDGLKSKFTEAGVFFGDAIAEAVNGQTGKLAAIGGVIGDIIIAGLQATVITGLDNLGEKIGDALAYGAENLSIASKTMPSVAKGIGGFIRENTRSATNFGEQFTNARESSGFNASQQAVATEAAIAKGIRTGIDASMSDAVKAGILEAWKRQGNRGGSTATFSN